MAFNFYGTLTTGQWEEFRKFALIQSSDIQARILWLNRELLTVGVFTTLYDSATNLPISFSAVPQTSYASKLLQAYRILGGNPERDMILRTSDQPVFLTKASPMVVQRDGTVTGGFTDQFTNGKRYRGSQRFDRDLGFIIERFKKWQLEAIKRKREHLEFKIKRALDYSDQLQIERDLLTIMTAPASTSTVDDQIVKIETLFHRPGAMNVIDNLNDIFGFGIGRPGDTAYQNAEQVAQGEDQRLF